MVGLSITIPAPAHWCVIAQTESARVVYACNDVRPFRSFWRVSLLIPVQAPTDHAVVFPDAARMIPTSDDVIKTCINFLVGNGLLAVMIQAPTNGRPITIPS